MFDPLTPPREGGSVPELYNVTLSNPGKADAAIILPGQTEPTRKRYPYVIPGTEIQAGAQALAIKISGTYVLLGGSVPDPTPAPNLLDNWYFVGTGSQTATGANGAWPINQRGQTSYSATSEYTIDRWQLTSGSMTLTATGLQLNGTIRQRLPVAVGTNVTCSVLLADGTMPAGAATYNNSSRLFTLTLGNKTAVAVKLEVGSSQTLARKNGSAYVLNEMPDFAAQLLNCQRYFYRYKPGRVAIFANGYYNNANGLITYSGNLGVPFGGVANGSLTGTLYATSYGHAAGNSLEVMAIGELKMFPGGLISGNVTTAGTTAALPCVLAIRDETSYIDFSCDI